MKQLLLLLTAISLVLFLGGCDHRITYRGAEQAIIDCEAHGSLKYVQGEWSERVGFSHTGAQCKDGSFISRDYDEPIDPGAPR